MDPDSFAEGPAASGMLNEKEISNVLLYHHNRNLIRSIFPTKGRQHTGTVSILFSIPVSKINELRQGGRLRLSEYRTKLFGAADDWMFYLWRCNIHSCGYSGPERGRGCCMVIQVYPLSSCKKFMWTDYCWSEMINSDPQKSTRSAFYVPDGLPGGTVTQFCTLRLGSSLAGFINDGRFCIKVLLLVGS